MPRSERGMSQKTRGTSDESPRATADCGITSRMAAEPVTGVQVIQNHLRQRPADDPLEHDARPSSAACFGRAALAASLNRPAPPKAAPQRDAPRDHQPNSRIVLLWSPSATQRAQPSASRTRVRRAVVELPHCELMFTEQMKSTPIERDRQRHASVCILRRGRTEAHPKWRSFN